MASIDRLTSEECRPLRTNADLLQFSIQPVLWNNLIVPLADRSKPVQLGDDFDLLPDTNPFQVNRLRNQLAYEANRPQVLVCHDLAGNYRDDRFVKGSRKWDDYRFYHWSGIDYFCYFSHEYITIPTLQWLNAAHRNGVKVLGTYIVESHDGRRRLMEVLQSVDQMRLIAEAMIHISKHCRFEGWLINVECDLPDTSIPMLYEFVKYLTERIHEVVPGSVIIWYDSIISTGQLLWQNELNEKNERFFDLADGILLNYGWNERNLDRTVRMARSLDRMKRIFVGIDVFGRGQVAKFQTDETLAKIKKHNLSVGIFAPGWTFEGQHELGIDIRSVHGNEICNNNFIIRNDRFWNILWRYFDTFGPRHLPFYTSFCIGSGCRYFRDGYPIKTEPWFNLTKQKFQPSVPNQWIQRYFEDAYNGGSCLRITPSGPNLRLFTSNFYCERDLVCSYAFKRASIDLTLDLDLLLNVIDDRTGQWCRIVCGDYQDQEVNGLVFVAGANDIGRIIRPIQTKNLSRSLAHIRANGFVHLPIVTPLNGWEIRHFYINFEPIMRPRIVDIGIRTRGSANNASENWILLGAISLHEGNDDISDIYDAEKITTWDFVE